MLPVALQKMATFVSSWIALALVLYFCGGAICLREAQGPAFAPMSINAAMAPANDEGEVFAAVPAAGVPAGAPVVTSQLAPTTSPASTTEAATEPSIYAATPPLAPDNLSPGMLSAPMPINSNATVGTGRYLHRPDCVQQVLQFPN